MASRGTQTNSLGLAAPIGVLAAILLAGAIFVVPMPFLAPDPVELPALKKAPPAENQKPFVPEAPPWAELASSLTSLREPPPEVPEGATAIAEAPQTTAAPQLGWRYIGYIEEPRGLSAVVAWSDTSHRILSEGEVVTDPSAPGGEVTIVHVQRDKLTVSQHGKEVEFTLAQGDATIEPQTHTITPPPRPGPGRRGGMQPNRTDPRPKPGPPRSDSGAQRSAPPAHTGGHHA